MMNQTFDLSWKIGTIDEIQGMGYEVLVDKESRTEILGFLFNGNFMLQGSTAVSSELGQEPTLIASA